MNGKVSNWDKFILLLWKNWTLQWNRKVQLVAEIFIPVLFSLLLVFMRTLVDVEPKNSVRYTEQNISTLNILNEQQISTQIKMMLLYSPKNTYVDKIIEDAAKSLNVFYSGYNNAELLNLELKNYNYLAGVQFDDALSNLTEYPKKLSFALRFPSELRTSTKKTTTLTWYTNRLFPIFETPGPRNPNKYDGGIPVGYLREGFLPIQHEVSMSYIKLAGKDQNAILPEVVMQRFPYPAYISDKLLENLASIIPLIIVLSFIYPCVSTTRYITTEKEKQLKEVMKIMGLQNWIHWTAWFVKSFIVIGISTVLITIFIKIKWKEDVAVLTHSSFSALLVFLLIYIISSICFCFMMATFFSKSSTAAAVTGLVWFITFIPFSFMEGYYDDLDLGTKLGWSLLSNVAMGFGFKVIFGFEGTSEGLQWSNIFTPSSVDDNLPLGAVIIMLIVASILYIIICLYVEQIFPGDYGVPKKWYFPFTKSFWCNGTDYAGIEDLATNNDAYGRNLKSFDIEPTDKIIGLQVKNLKKKFGDKMVVKGVSMNMYEDEITVLLGHNGAGKTTTISILTGMFPPTSGTAIINGCDIRANIEGARMSLGICPQHNVLFDDMSVSNHIVFFSRLKGLKGDAIQKEVDKYLKMINLKDKANVASSKLSGGMKRKLSICCALCGDTKVVLCDEPSSGMDPAARRQLWNLLQSEKMGRTILLTTHFMDEADVLGDRVAIMCDGDLKCHGTSFFLKKKYGSGYHLICVKRDNCNSADVTALLRKYISNISPESEIGAELCYQLPDNYASIFEKMLGELEEKSEKLNLNGYGIGMTSLEEVFMKVGAENLNGETDQTIQQNDTADQQYIRQNSYNGSNEYVNSSISSSRENLQLQDGTQLFKSQWKAMFLKKFFYTFRNKLMFCIQSLIPIFFVVVTILISRTSSYSQLKPMTIGLTQYPLATTVLSVASNVTNDSVESKIAENYKSIAASYGDNYKLAMTGDKTFTDYILKLGETYQVRINSHYVAAATIAKDKIIAWLNNQPLHTAPLTVNLVHNAIAKEYVDKNCEISITNAPLPFKTQTQFSQLNMGNNLGTQLATNICFCMCFVSAFFVLFVIKERESRSKLLQFVGGVKVWTFWLSQMLWDFCIYILIAIIVIATIACFQEKGFTKFTDLARYFLVLIIFGFSVVPFTYLISYLYKEPAIGFARASIFNIFGGLALFIVVTIMSMEIFDTKPVADGLQWIFRVIPHFSLAMSLNKLYTNVIIKDICKKIDVIQFDICIIFPKCCTTPDYFAWKEPGVLPEVIYMVVTGVVIFLILIIREYGFINELIYKIQKKTIQLPSSSEDGFIDEDVEREKQRILYMPTIELAAQNLVLDRVTKYYGQFLAVNQISLCVNRSECFGLLGVNGAGKTTTFKMMTGDERISSGAAYVKGMSLESDMVEIYKEIGYCPQFDALLEDLTGREILKIFCLLRGVNENSIKKISEDLAESFCFTKHLDKETKAYSGGNKRKLSTAISVIGNPSVIYLDEPTTGMDPSARRQLWNVLCRIRDTGKSIVLTSHSMEECEALCTRLAIMVNGEFKCIGSTQHLKNKFSKGLIFKMKIKQNLETNKGSNMNDSLGNDQYQTFRQQMQRDIENVKEFIMHEFPEAILQEEYQGILTFYIPISSIKWSKIFGLIEKNREKLRIEDYSISQTTLEEIFLEFAKYQREDPRKVDTNSGCRKCWGKQN